MKKCDNCITCQFGLVSCSKVSFVLNPNLVFFLIIILLIIPVYSFSQPIYFSVSGKVYESSYPEPIEGCTVQLIASDGSYYETKTDKAGYFNFDSTKVEVDSSYKISCKIPGYLSIFQLFSTSGLTESKSFAFNFSFPITHGCAPLRLIDNHLNATFDFNSANLSDSMKNELDYLVNTLRENPTLIISLIGFIDEQEIVKNDTLLPANRVTATYNYLVIKGVNKKRLICVKNYSIEPFQINYQESCGFQENTVLSKIFIDSLSSPIEKSNAHKLNRRVEFEITSTDFIE